MRFAAKKNTRCPKAPRDFRQEKMAFSIPRRVALGLPSPSPRVCTRGRTYADVTTKISRIDRLPDLFTYGAPRDPLQNANSALSHSANQMRVILALGRSEISNFTLVRKKIKKNALYLNQSAFSNLALYVISLGIYWQETESL